MKSHKDVDYTYLGQFVGDRLKKRGKRHSIYNIVESYLYDDTMNRNTRQYAINRFIGNVTGLMYHNHGKDSRMIKHWQEVFDNIEAGDDQAKCNAKEERDNAKRMDHVYYNWGRDDLAEALQLIRETRMILLTGLTAQNITLMDNDGRLSKKMGLNVKEYYGLNSKQHGWLGSQANIESDLAPVPIDKIRVDYSRNLTNITPEQALKEPVLVHEYEGKPRRDGLRPIKEALLEVIAELEAEEKAKSQSNDMSLGY